MNKLCLLILSLLIYISGFSQILSVDTACSGTPVLFTTPAGSITHTWIMDTVNISQTPGPFTSAGVSGLNTSNYTSTVYDNGSWYSFISNAGTAEVIKLTYATSPNGSFTQSSLGTFGPAGKLEGIDIIKDTATGNWYGFTVNNVYFYHMNFGTSLANMPTVTCDTLYSLDYPHQLNIAKYGTQWIGFAGNRGSTIARLDFGTLLTSKPVVTNITNVGSASTPCNFALHQESGNWYMLVANLTANSVSRYSFGTNIQNNSPTGI